MAVQQLDEHPFAYRKILIYTLSTDLFLGTEILEALIERRCIVEDEFLSAPRSIKKIWIIEKNNIKMFGIFLKDHVDHKPIRLDIKQAIKTLKYLLVKFELKSVALIKDLGIFSILEWNFIIEQINKTFKVMEISILFFRNNLPVPKVEGRYRLIKEYHESAIGGHKGMTKTYDKLEYEYYWRNMQSDLRQYVHGCPDCQSQKLARVKTRLPMLISDTLSRPFCKISIDFVRPKEPKQTGNRYILTIQDSFSKFCIFVTKRHATAEEVTHALLEKFICYFGSPTTLISDQGIHFINAVLEEFARIFKINKFLTTAYHP